jgi:hypothetical protein
VKDCGCIKGLTVGMASRGTRYASGRTCIIRDPTYSRRRTARSVAHYLATSRWIMPRAPCSRRAGLTLLSALWSLQHVGRDGPALLGYDLAMNDCMDTVTLLQTTNAPPALS